VNIYLGRVPFGTKKQDIKDFINPVLKGHLLQKPGMIKHIKIFIFENEQTNKKEYHGIIGITPDHVATRVQKKLEETSLKNKLITLYSFFLHPWFNDQQGITVSNDFYAVKSFHKNV